MNIQQIVINTVTAAVLCTTMSARATDLRDWGKKYVGSQRFTVLTEFNNEAVLDRETQLVWPRTWSNAESSGTNARGLCANSTIGGRKGWRLPFLPELMSLIDPAVIPSVPGAAKLPAGHPFVNIVSANPLGAGPYWTATWDRIASMNATVPGMVYAWEVNLDTGVGATAGLALDAKAVCVRSGAPLAEY